MKQKQAQYNYKGFLHHPDTPQEDKEFYLAQRKKVQGLMQLGLEFIEKDGVLGYRSQKLAREEFGANSKFLHRGVYCPSPVLDLLITNAKRGKILVRPSPRSKITHRFRYAQDGRMLYIDNYLESKMVSSEYLQYKDETLYGITIGMSGRLLGVSEEQYENGRLLNYVLVHFWGDNENLTCPKAYCEQYEYDSAGLKIWDYYQLDYGAEQIASSGYVMHVCYQFERKDGMITHYRILKHPKILDDLVVEIDPKHQRMA